MHRFFTRKMHAYIDYPVAFGLIVMPFVLGVGAGNAIAFGLSIATGIAALVLTSLTDHETGLVPVLSYRLHLAVDGLVGAAFVAAPFVFGFSGFDAAYYWILGATVLVVVSTHKGDDVAAQPAE